MTSIPIDPPAPPAANPQDQLQKTQQRNKPAKRKRKKSLPQWTHWPAYYAIRSLIAIPNMAGIGPSLHAAAALGRWYGNLPLNAKRVERAAWAIQQALPGTSDQRAHELAISSYEHLVRLAVEVIYTPRLMTQEGTLNHIELTNIDLAIRELSKGKPVILICGHCGNWELCGTVLAALGYPMHALFRPLDNKPMNRWLSQTRERGGLMLVDKFGAVKKLPDLVRSGTPVAFVADQNAGDRGVFVPFLGRLTSTYKSIGLLALETNATLICGSSMRIVTGREQAGGLEDQGFRYRLSLDDLITPEEYLDQPDPLFYLTARYRRAIEVSIKRAPEQYLWIHRMWKSRPRHERLDKPFPNQLKEKLHQLPWMSDSDVQAIINKSEEDRTYLRDNNITRLI